MVAAGILPAVEPGILPGGMAVPQAPKVVRRRSGRQDAALYGRQDARRYMGGSVRMHPPAQLKYKLVLVFFTGRISLGRNSGQSAPSQDSEFSHEGFH